MLPDHFDDLTRNLAVGVSRRRVLGGLLSALATALTGGRLFPASASGDACNVGAVQECIDKAADDRDYSLIACGLTDDLESQAKDAIKKYCEFIAKKIFRETFEECQRFQCNGGQICVDGHCCTDGRADCCPPGRPRCGGILFDTHDTCLALGQTCCGSAVPCDADKTCCTRSGIELAMPDAYKDSHCANLQEDRYHCGACFRPCDIGQQCCHGQCFGLSDVSHCGGCDQPVHNGEICCDGHIVPKDAQNCGACGFTCSSCQTCNGESCVELDCGDPCKVCQGGTCVEKDCGDPCKVCQGGTCVSRANADQCQTCVGGVVSAGCGLCDTCTPVSDPSGGTVFQCKPVDCGDPCLTCVGGTCTPIDCGDPCRQCSGGVCQDIPNCCGGQSCAGACCSGVCVDTGSDNSNCGSCGTVCQEGSSCQGGACMNASVGCGERLAPCPAGYYCWGDYGNDHPVCCNDRLGVCACPGGYGPHQPNDGLCWWQG